MLTIFLATSNPSINFPNEAYCPSKCGAEKFINEVEIGRKIVQESFIEKAAKILNADLNDVSMVVTDEILMEERKSYIESNKKPTKNIPLLLTSLTK